jgi:hypothetical protein
MATIDFLMAGKKPGEIKIRRSGWPRTAWIRPLTKGTEYWRAQMDEKTESLLQKGDDEATDWVIVTDAKRRR